MNEREESFGRTQAIGRRDSVRSVLDLARSVATRANSVAPILRALTVEQIYIRLGQDGTIAVSHADGIPFVHAYTSPIRLTTSYTAEDSQISMTALYAAQLMQRFSARMGLLLDPRTDAQFSLEPDHVRELVAMSAGVATPATVTTVEGEELRIIAGPDIHQVDREVAAAMPGARVRRCVVDLDGVGGQTWPTYLIDGPDLDMLATMQLVDDTAGRRVISLVNGSPDWLATRIAAAQDVAIALPRP